MSLVNGHRRPLELNGASLSPDDQQPSPLTSPLLNDGSILRTDDEEENRRKVREQAVIPNWTTPNLYLNCNRYEGCSCVILSSFPTVKCNKIP